MTQHSINAYMKANPDADVKIAAYYEPENEYEIQSSVVVQKKKTKLYVMQSIKQFMKLFLMEQRKNWQNNILVKILQVMCHFTNKMKAHLSICQAILAWQTQK